MTPTVWPPAARTARATAPMQDTWPPPLTRVQPRRPSSVPTAVARVRWRASMRSLEAQKTQTAVRRHD